jgi:hypothetical protein
MTYSLGTLIAFEMGLLLSAEIMPRYSPSRFVLYGWAAACSLWGLILDLS